MRKLEEERRTNWVTWNRDCGWDWIVPCAVLFRVTLVRETCPTRMSGIDSRPETYQARMSGIDPGPEQRGSICVGMTQSQELSPPVRVIRPNRWDPLSRLGGLVPCSQKKVIPKEFPDQMTLCMHCWPWSCALLVNEMARNPDVLIRNPDTRIGVPVRHPK